MLVKDDLGAAVERVKKVFERRPDMALHDDVSATSRWHGGVRFESVHPTGAKVVTDMPAEIGGSGDKATPGWLFRAGLASCTGVTILLTAAEAGIEITELEIKVTSRSDSRGLFGMPDESGAHCYAGPIDLAMHVRIGADGVPAQRLMELVDRSMKRSPVGNVAENASPIALAVEVAG
jgi:uncharacterized OsmC-like protein